MNENLKHIYGSYYIFLKLNFIKLNFENRQEIVKVMI